MTTTTKSAFDGIDSVIGTALTHAHDQVWREDCMVPLTSVTVTGEPEWTESSWRTFLDCVRSFFGIPAEDIMWFLESPETTSFSKIADSPSITGLALYGNSFPTNTVTDATTEDSSRPNPGELAVGPSNYPLANRLS